MNGVGFTGEGGGLRHDEFKLYEECVRSIHVGMCMNNWWALSKQRCLVYC
jgi:hypothetical protein